MMMLDRKTKQLRWLIRAEAEAGKKLSAKGVNVIPLCEVYPFQQHLSKHRSQGAHCKAGELGTTCLPAGRQRRLMFSTHLIRRADPQSKVVTNHQSLNEG